ncbi:BrnT family toxin [Acidocella aquatica]|uniref:BrnT family toxin n=1 Tax=Acidocella aquatica TaxID=1922313 RepID=UPI0024E0B068|nr:BrnT family toxin [Acidocella aquatica]
MMNSLGLIRKPRQTRSSIKVSFEQTRAVFRDPFADDALADREDYGEERWNITGLDATGNVLVVTYTMRGPLIHIISARKAESDERSEYFEGRH